jgi:hypothetical protein
MLQIAQYLLSQLLEYRPPLHLGLSYLRILEEQNANVLSCRFGAVYMICAVGVYV